MPRVFFTVGARVDPADAQLAATNGFTGRIKHQTALTRTRAGQLSSSSPGLRPVFGASPTKFRHLSANVESTRLPQDPLLETRIRLHPPLPDTSAMSRGCVATRCRAWCAWRVCCSASPQNRQQARIHTPVTQSDTPPSGLTPRPPRETQNPCQFNPVYSSTLGASSRETRVAAPRRFLEHDLRFSGNRCTAARLTVLDPCSAAKRACAPRE
jgi:hypothetical protein